MAFNKETEELANAAINELLDPTDAFDPRAEAAASLIGRAIKTNSKEKEDETHSPLYRRQRKYGF